MNPFYAILIGMFSGITSGLFGVGGGIIIVPLLLFLCSPPIRDIKQAIGTSLVVIIPTAIMGSFRHQPLGNIHWPAVAWLIPAAVAGSFLGVWLTTQVSAEHLRRSFAAFLILVGLQLFFKK